METNTPINAEPVTTETRAARPEDRPAHRPGPTTDTLWAVAEVAAYLQLSTSSIYKMTRRLASVRIPHIRIGSKLRFRKADIDRWLSLMTTSNLDTLTKMRERTTKGTYGHDP